MSSVESILLIILGIGFAVLLVMGIILTFVIIRIFTNVKHVTERVDETTENLSGAVGYVAKKVGPVAVSMIGSMMLRGAKSKIKRSKGDKK